MLFKKKNKKKGIDTYTLYNYQDKKVWPQFVSS